MREIKLTQGKVTLVDDVDFDYLTHWEWCAHRQYQRFYAVRREGVAEGRRGGGYLVKMHKVIAERARIVGVNIDHRDGDGLNNQRLNLRGATKAQNGMNRSKNRNNTTGYKGVERAKTGFVARIMANGKRMYCGIYRTPHEAARAYDKAALELHGEFAVLNFPKV